MNKLALSLSALAIVLGPALDAHAQSARRNARSTASAQPAAPTNTGRDVSTPSLPQATGASATCGLDGEDVLCRSNARQFSIAVASSAQGTCASIALARSICERVINHVDAMELVLRARVRATVTEGAENRGAYLAAMHARLPDALVHQRAWCSQLVSAVDGPSAQTAQRPREDLAASSMAVVIHRAGREVSGPALATAVAAAPLCRSNTNTRNQRAPGTSDSAPRAEPALVSGAVAVGSSAPSVASAPEPRVVGAVQGPR
jgi:hypothetical protein